MKTLLSLLTMMHLAAFAATNVAFKVTATKQYVDARVDTLSNALVTLTADFSTNNAQLVSTIEAVASSGPSGVDTNTVEAIVTNLVTQGWWGEWAFSGGVDEQVRYSVQVYSVGEGEWNADLYAGSTIASFAPVDGPNPSLIVFTNTLPTSITAVHRRIPPESASDLVNNLGFVTVGAIRDLQTQITAISNMLINLANSQNQ